MVFWSKSRSTDDVNSAGDKTLAIKLLSSPNKATWRLDPKLFISRGDTVIAYIYIVSVTDEKFGI